MDILWRIPQVNLLLQRFLAIIHSIQLKRTPSSSPVPLLENPIEDDTLVEDEQEELTPHFFKLPREVRDLIYGFTLTYPKTYWDTRHKALCPNRSRHAMRRDSLTPSTETPTFVNRPAHIVLMESRKLIAGLPVPRYIPCNCNRYYTGNSLLRTNRQINFEASKVFYSANTLTFEDDRVLCRFLTTARPHIRAHVKHISLLGLDPRDADRMLNWRDEGSFPLLSNNPSDDPLSPCVNLQTLELRPKDLVHSGAPGAIAACFGKRNLKVTMVICRPLLEAGEEEKELDALWVKVSQPLVMSGKGKPFTGPNVLEFLSSVVDHCTLEAKQRLKLAMGQKPKATTFTTRMSHMELSWTYGVNWETITPGTDWQDPVPVLIDIWGLPSTEKVRARLSQEEIRHNRELKSKGLPTMAEVMAEDEQRTKMRAAKLAKHQKRLEKIAAKEAKIAILRESELQKKEENRLEWLREQKFMEKEAMKDKWVRMARESRVAREDRNNERKRTFRNGTKRQESWLR